MTAAPPGHSPAPFIVCEDGHEYTDRFVRLLGATFRFVRAGGFAEAQALSTAGAAGILLDLDFRRTPQGALIDDEGRPAATAADSERRRLCAVQGILILRALRRSGVALPALLFADLDDAEQIAFLQDDLRPLQVVPSSVGLSEIARLLTRMVAGGA